MDSKTSQKQHRYIYSNSQQYIVWVKITNFFFLKKKEIWHLQNIFMEHDIYLIS